jgi:hypothetical protein
VRGGRGRALERCADAPRESDFRPAERSSCLLVTLTRPERCGRLEAIWAGDASPAWFSAARHDGSPPAVPPRSFSAGKAPAERPGCRNRHVDAPRALWKTRGHRAAAAASASVSAARQSKRGVEAESAGGQVKVAAKLVLLVAVGLLVCAVPSASTHTGQLGPPCTSGASSIRLGGTARDDLVSARLRPSVIPTPPSVQIDFPAAIERGNVVIARRGARDACGHGRKSD